MENEKEKDAIPKFQELVERLEKANTEGQQILKRQEELYARSVLGGQSDAGILPKPVKPETPAEYKERVMKGQL